MRTRNQGVVLIVGLLVLLLMTLFALVAMMRSSTELMMAASEQYRRRAAQAGSAAIEDAIAKLGSVPAVPGTQVTRGPTPLAQGTLERFSSHSEYVGRETLVPGASIGAIGALDYIVRGFGTSARTAQDMETQGLVVIAPTNGVSAFTRIASGLP